MASPPELNDVLPDFRSEKPTIHSQDATTTRSIQLARSIQQTMAQLNVSAVQKLPNFDAATKSEIEVFALEVRSYFDITLADQIECDDARVFYNLCRRKIEDRGIFVIHGSFDEGDGSGFCLADSPHPVIFINTRKQTRGRRLFTLIHELAHVLMGQSGLSDPFVRKNTIETRCNWFAAAFLVPREYVPKLLANVSLDSDASPKEVARASRRLKISQQATVLRLEELGYFDSGSHDKWLNIIHNSGNPDFAKEGGGGKEPPPQEKVKLAKYGFRLARVFGELLDRGDVSEISIYRASGLKPKYQRAYFEYANSLAESDLHSLELGDG